MSRLTVPTRDDAPEGARPLLDDIYRQFGRVPAVYRLMATSPEILKGFFAMGSAIDSTLDLKLRLRISIAVAQANGCDYCLSANRFVAVNRARIGPDEIELNRQGASSDPVSDVAVRFATQVTHRRGRVADDEVRQVRDAGYSEAQIVEIVALVAHCTFANYLNEVAQTDIDFPVLRTQELKS